MHDKSYVECVARFCESLGSDRVVGELPTGDTMVCADSYEMALLAAGGAIEAVARGRPADPALAVVRPPGHHAEPARGMGFCVFNNVAVAAQWARQRAGAVLIADFDYHHGNGTQAWVERALVDGQAPVGFLSTHAYPAYPGTGAFAESHLRDRGFVVDVPLGLSTATDDFIAVWATLLPALARRIEPKVIIVSAGFDFLASDPIAGLPIGLRAVDALSALLGDVARHHEAGLALVLEGGYSLENLRASATSLAHNLGNHAVDAAVPAASLPRDGRLREMTQEVLHWLM